MTKIVEIEIFPRLSLISETINWIVLKSTQKGLLENVKDGISRPIGSREIQKTKVETDLLDTLYLVVLNEY